MIRATVTFGGTFVDKPIVKYIDVDEDQVALEKKNEQTNKFETLTVRQLYDNFLKRKSYNPGATSQNPAFQGNKSSVKGELFEDWFHKKHFIYEDSQTKEKREFSWVGRILNIKYDRI